MSNLKRDQLAEKCTRDLLECMDEAETYSVVLRFYDAALAEKSVREKALVEALKHMKMGLTELKERDLGALGLYEYAREALKAYEEKNFANGLAELFFKKDDGGKL